MVPKVIKGVRAIEVRLYVVWLEDTPQHHLYHRERGTYLSFPGIFILLICDAARLFRLLDGWFLRRDRTDWGYLHFSGPGPSVPPASNRPSSCESWTSVASGSVFGLLDLSQCLDLYVLGCHWQRKERGLLKLAFRDPCPSPCQHFSTFPLVAYLTCVSNERKKLCDDLTGYLYALSLSRKRYKHVLHTFKDRFIRFSCVICSFYPVCVRYLHGSYVARPLLVLYTFSSRTVIVRFMRFILRFRVPTGARISIFTTGQQWMIQLAFSFIR